MDVIPSQAQDLPNPQRAGKGKVHRNIEFTIFTRIQSLTNCCGIPNRTGFALYFRQGGILKWVLRNNVPSYSLLKGAFQEFVDICDSGRGHVLRGRIAIFPNSARGLLQPCEKLICRHGVYVLNQLIANKGVDIVSDQSAVCFVSGRPPFLYTVQGNKILQKGSYRQIAGGNKGIDLHFVFNFCFACLCFFLGIEGLPLLLALALVIRVIIHDIEFISTLSD